MLRVIGCITNEHDIRLVVLAVSICLLGCYTAFSLTGRANATSHIIRYVWLIAAAFVCGGSVWATHFVAELAFRPGLPIAFDLGLTALSAAIAVVMSVAGLGLALTSRRSAAPFGGAIVGFGISAMHYTGMAALHLPAVRLWDFQYVFISIVFCVLVSTLAVSAALRRRGIAGQLQGTGFLALAIIGLHFTGMTSVTFMPDPTIVIPDQALSPEWLAVAIAAITLLIVGLGLIGSVVDHHLADRSVTEAENLRKYIAELEITRRELSNALERADAANKAKSAFLANMSHELRTPLNAIIGFSEVIKMAFFGPLNERYRAYGQDIFSSGIHLLRLINDVLDLSKLESSCVNLHDEDIDPVKLVQASVLLVAPQAARAKIQISEHFEAHLPLIRVDERRIVQVIVNLLSNAVKFSAEGGVWP